MIGGWLAPRLDLPLGRDASGRFLPLIIALMVYLTGLGGVGLLLLGDTVRDWDRSLSASLTVQVPADASAGRLETLVALLHQTPGVVGVSLLGPEETAKLVEPWLGRLRGFALRLQGIIGAGLTVVAVLLVLTVVFAARTGLAIHQPVIEVLHLLGAPDRYIARQFQRHAWWLGLRGGLLGSIAAALTVVVLAQAGGALELPLPATARGLADWRLWGLLAAAAFAAGLAAMVTARATILRRLTRMP